jgi:hypothetical protein
MAHEICRFDELGGDNTASAGGKGANLGELTRAGFPVPAGFVHFGVDSISVNPDADRARRVVAAAERRLLPDAATMSKDRER